MFWIVLLIYLLYPELCFDIYIYIMTLLFLFLFCLSCDFKFYLSILCHFLWQKIRDHFIIDKTFDTLKTYRTFESYLRWDIWDILFYILRGRYFVLNCLIHFFFYIALIHFYKFNSKGKLTKILEETKLETLEKT